MADPARTVALFVTCLVDLFRPGVAEAAARLLEQAGFRVAVPAQTCCGQANFNGGDRSGAAQLARRMIEVFRDFEYVVAPSGSCAGMIRDYPDLFQDAPADRAEAEALAARTWELTAFLRDVAHILPQPLRWEATATYHDSCSSLRQLGIREQPRALLGAVGGLALREIRNPEECCGFGGAFCVKYPAISTHVGDQKIDDIVATGASHLIGGDLGCLLHLEGRMQRRGIAIHALHVAEVLAGMAPGTRRGND
jgi:L-lactate dehydrogenase complex protein LldE